MLKRKPYPILEFDPSPKAYFQPPGNNSYKNREFHERVVFCFFKDVVDQLIKKRRARKIAAFWSEMGEHPAYEVRAKGGKVSVMHPGIGSSLAAGFLDECIAMGGRKFVACGGAGVLQDLALGHLIVPTSAVRDEGASYHYQPPAREVAPHPKAVAAIKKTLAKHEVPFVTGKTWTTDGFYRETREKLKARKMEGCISVEMECAAFFAVARFRKVQCGQILYSGDDLSGETHNNRDWQKRGSIREKVFWLAVEACLQM